MFQLDDRRFNRLTLLGVVLGFALLITAFVAGIITLASTERSSRMVDHTYEVVDQLSQVNLNLERSETALRGYLLSPAPERIRTYRGNSEQLFPALNKLGELVSDNPAQQRHIAELRPLLLLQLSILDRTMDLAEAGRGDEARAFFVNEVRFQRVNKIRAITADMRATEERLLVERAAEEQRSISIAKWILAIAGSLMLLLGAATTFLVRRYTVDLTRARDRLNLLNTDLESVVAERTAGLKRANEEIQRFAYIVSHDLRSPLVNVMGFTAELDRAGGLVTGMVDRIDETQPDLVKDDERLAAKEDLPEAVGFIRSSTQKMDRLINAILALSRQGRRVLTPEHLPMDRVVGEIADSLATQAEERGATIEVVTPLPDITHDRLAIEQIFSNLIENATKYLQPGRPGRIVIRGRSSGRRAIYEVEDNGRGIAPEDHTRVFDLFRRAGSQETAGEGIGLANVRALAYRLGGFVSLRSVLSEGSTFIVDLPAEFSGDDKE